MSILPELVPNLQEQINNIKQIETNSKMGKSFLFDFNRGDFVLKDGKLVEIEGIEALKVWVEKILKTEKFKFKIYENSEINEYGVTLLELINKDYPIYFVESEIQREVTEALLKNAEINSVSNFTFSKEGRGLNISFEVSSIYGTTRNEVII